MLKFDKILVDAPCSGDGAIRKIPDRWTQFSPIDGNNLHYVQVQLLIRALKMVKEGGLVVYSTCSLNAIENEAVITEIFSHFNKDEEKIMLEDIHGQLKGFKMRKGLKKWSLFNYTDEHQLEIE